MSPRSPRAERGRDAAALDGFVERFAATLEDAGFARMAARVFATLLTTDSGRLTASELAERLQASPAAISGAVRYLIQINLVSRERQPGTRRDVYRVHDDAWYEALVRRDQMLARWERDLQDGVEVLGPDTPAGRRLEELIAFVEFTQEELPNLIARWRERRGSLRSHDSQGRP